MAEVAGLVLGAIPLLITALEHADDIQRPFKKLWHWERYRNDQIRQLNYCSVAYDQTLRLLLKNVVDDEELSEMLEDPQCNAWGRSGLEQDLKVKLGMAYDSCISTILEMDLVMRDIASNIDKLGGSSLVQTAGLRAVLNANSSPAQRTSDRTERFRFATRLRYTMSNRGIKESLKKLKECNERLDDFIGKAGMIQDDFSSPSPKISFIMPLDDIRQDATRIYDTIARSWCASHNTHTAAWRLESRIRRRKKAGKRLMNQTGCEPGRFNVSVLDSSHLVWLHTEFNCQTGIERLTSARQGPKVMFVESALEERPFEVSEASIQVTDICSTLNNDNTSAIEFCIDNDGGLRYHSRRSADPYLSIDQRGHTLNELLSNQQFNFGVSMESYTLVINLITALVQLGGTPWLRKSWSKKDIMFFAMQGSNIGHPHTTLHPYLINHHPPDDNPKNGLNHSHEVDCNNIATLGVMLLEMQSGCCIEELRTSEDGAFSTGTNLVVARRVLHNLYHRGSMSEGFTRAITYCLQSSINPAASLTDKEFVDSFVEETVGPLEKERRMLMGY